MFPQMSVRPSIRGVPQHLVAGPFQRVPQHLVPGYFIGGTLSLVPDSFSGYPGQDRSTTPSSGTIGAPPGQDRGNPIHRTGTGRMCEFFFIPFIIGVWHLRFLKL